MATPAGTLAVEILRRVVGIGASLTLGLGLASLALQFGAVEYVTRLAGPLTRAANLPPEAGTAVLATTVSPTAGYGMLAEYRESGLLSDRGALVAVTVNTVFGYVQHLFVYYGPVLVPILGLDVGVFYVGVRGCIALGITVTGIAAGSALLAPPDDGEGSGHADDGEGSGHADDGTDAGVDAGGDDVAGTTDGRRPDRPDDTRGKLRAAGRETATRLRGILPRLLVVYTLVVVLLDRADRIDAVLGLPDAGQVVGPVAAAAGLPEAAIPAIAVFAVDTTSGAVFIAPFVESGAFTPRQAVATMLVGGILSFAVSTFKRSIPFQYGVWGPEFGTKVIAVNTALKVGFIGAALAVLLG